MLYLCVCVCVFLRLYHASEYFGMASEYFDRQRFASDKRELHLREVLHTVLCPLAQIQSFGCLIRWRLFRQPTAMIRWFQGAAVVAGTIHTVVRGMSEEWFHEASVLADTMYI